MKALASAVLAAAMGAGVPAFAQHSHGGHAASSAHAESGWAMGEVKKVDKDSGKVTLKHGPLANLDMPGMTMVFRVKDPAMLEALQPGKNIQFKADKVGGNITVTEIKKE